MASVLERLTPNKLAHELNQYLEQELGIDPKVNYSFNWPNFFASCEVRDLLDSVTLAAQFFKRKGHDPSTLWRGPVRRIFAEEHLAYEIDDECIVHPAVDIEFQRNRAATVAGLQSPRYANSLVAFERISDELAATPPNAKEAWRAVFGAVEGLFRLMFPSAPHLNAGAVDAYLAPAIQKAYAGESVALRAANKQLASFKDWVDASHNYRHEQGSEEPIQPPLDLAVLAVSNGASYLRWLIAIDQSSL
ncbi:hypothetical protein [Bradyrhizobium guangxiense]|uniref:hypothetical protein n=1 Tax=Bradyrhizobium guangxiense TaxID=1325115 RepID=UPI0010092694|nr:hypothetical protein [Bradyrhizobium guangxiense]